MPGYTQLPNFVFELAPSLTEAELRVLLYLYRRIEGWHKDSDQISLSQFQDGTGLSSKSHIVEALRSLEARHLILATRHSTKTTKFQLVPEADKQLVPLPDKRLVPPVRQELVPQADTQKKPKKEDLRIWKETKERLAKDSNPLHYATYFDGLELLSLTAKKLAISAPSQAVGDYVRSRCLPLIRKAVGRELEITVEVQIISTVSAKITG